MGPLSFYWLAAWFDLFGTQLAIARTLLVLTGAATASLVYWLCARAYGRDAGILAALVTAVLGIPLWPATSHHWDSNLFYICAIAAAAVWQKNDRRWAGSLAGFAAGVTAGFMLPKGILALAAVIAIRFVGSSRGEPRSAKALRSVVPPLVGVGCAWVPILVSFNSFGALGELLDATIVWPASRYPNANEMPYGFGLLGLTWGPTFAAWSEWLPVVAAAAISGLLTVPFLAVAALPGLGFGAGARWFFLRKGPVSEVPLWIGGTFLWLSELHRPDVMHLVWGSPLLLGAVIGSAVSWDRTRAGRLVRGTLALVVACVILLAAFKALTAAGAGVVQQTRRGAVRNFAFDDALQFLMTQTRAGEPVFVYPYYPMYYFLADIRNPTKLSVVMYGYNTDEQLSAVVKDLERTAPRYVLWDTMVEGERLKQWYPTYTHPPVRDRVIDTYLADHYEQIDTRNGFRILRRRPAPGI